MNGFSALLLSKCRNEDINIRGGYLNMLADTAVSASVIVAGLVMNYTNAYWVDPALSRIIVIFIITGTWGLFHEAFQLALSAVPANIEIKAVKAYRRFGIFMYGE